MLSLTNKYGIVESVIFSFSFLEEKIPFCICKTRFLFFIFSATQEKILQGYIVNSNITISIYIEILLCYSNINRSSLLSFLPKKKKKVNKIVSNHHNYFSYFFWFNPKNKTKQNLYIHTYIKFSFWKEILLCKSNINRLIRLFLSS